MRLRASTSLCEQPRNSPEWSLMMASIESVLPIVVVPYFDFLVYNG